ncbi:protein of unknown function [Noviherbaspirillum humi]|uniref:DUF4178 domain-containing protein n=1 Tax=Noviherbaspirillum humi TaxID=1688639 RepID=A0A239CNJ1_9BURK|nr:DUF4178 domain-containing protein [Noviherbaspirillum humi]SNS21432.1 protein of unknown function [Noviherbaspirillum humi]
MFNASCPACGAPLSFRSAASVIAVCEYCKATVHREGDAVRDMGRMASVLEDYSPIQIGTSGVFKGAEFTVIGRIQLRYDGGLWNEWHVMFNDGRCGWLSDASNQFTLTFETAGAGALPAFDELIPGKTFIIHGQAYLAADIRSAACTGGEGELPFRVGAGWQARVADFRSGSRFLTLDYSDADIPMVYAGQAVTLDDLHCQLLRAEDDIRDSAGKLKGGVRPLDCPSCGSSVRFVPGITRQLVCPSCRSLVDTTSRTAEVIDTATRMAAVDATTAIELGQQASISGKTFETIGLLRRSDDEGVVWTEYLLFNPQRGFLWLVETDEGWFQTRVLDEWPIWDGGDTAVLNGQRFRKASDYRAKTVFAAGAFNWKVKAGDTDRIVEFNLSGKALAAELGPNELTWSLSVPAPAFQMRAWFGDKFKGKLAPAKSSTRRVAKYFIVGLLIVNLIPLLMSFGKVSAYLLITSLALYLPAWVIDKAGAGKE